MVSFDKKLMLAATAMFASGVLYAAPAAAQATRTWVSGVGDDANPCSRTAPCKTFAGAISKTAAGGEINCIDPGGFGAVTITKSMSIICDDVEAGILVAGSPAITINAATTDVVTISGLDILAPSPTSGGTNGFNFLNGAVLNIRNTTIKGFNTNGILFQPQTASAQLNLDDVILSNNGNSADVSTSGIRVAPATNMTATVTLNNVRMSNTQNVGIRFDLSGTTGSRINLSVNNSAITNSGVGLQFKSAGNTIDGVVTNTVISGNSTLGVLGNGAGVTVRFGNNVITGNGSGSAAAVTGVNAGAGSALQSYNNNVLDGNFNSSNTLANGAFSTTISPH